MGKDATFVPEFSAFGFKDLRIELMTTRESLEGLCGRALLTFGGTDTVNVMTGTPGKFFVSSHPSRLRSLRPIVLFACIFFASSANSAPIIVGFSGVVTSVNDPNGFLHPNTNIGSVTTGTYTVDLEAGAIPSIYYCCNPSNVIGTEWQLSSVGSVVFDVENSGFSGAVDSLLILDDPVIDIGNGPIPLSDSWLFYSDISTDLSLQIGFEDTTNTRLNDESLFLNSTFNGWDLSRLFVFHRSDGLRILDVEITSLGIVPEPSTALLMLTGLIGLASYRRGRVRG